MFLVCAKGSGGHPQGVQGPRLADSKDPGLFGPVRGADLAKKTKVAHTFGSFGRLGRNHGGFGRIQGPGAVWAGPRGRPAEN